MCGSVWLKADRAGNSGDSQADQISLTRWGRVFYPYPNGFAKSGLILAHLLEVSSIAFAGGSLDIDGRLGNLS